MEKHPTPKEAVFIRAVIDGATKTDAYKKAYSVEGLGDEAIWKKAHEISIRPHVAAKIRDLQRAADVAATLNAAWVLREWATIATADPSELSRSRRVNCRHCWGEGHAYQWRNMTEWAQALADASTRSKEAPSDAGGYGFRGNKPPHPECPHCDGDGVEQVFLADLATVSPAARKLFAGIERTKDGFKIKTRDQDGALKNIAVYLSMLVNKVQHSGAVGTINLDDVKLTDAQKEVLKSVVTGLL